MINKEQLKDFKIGDRVKVRDIMNIYTGKITNIIDTDFLFLDEDREELELLLVIPLLESIERID